MNGETIGAWVNRHVLEAVEREEAEAAERQETGD